MRKFIAALASFTAIGFAVAIANSGDNFLGDSSLSESDLSLSAPQQAGIAAPTSLAPRDLGSAGTPAQKMSRNAKKPKFTDTAGACTADTEVSAYRSKAGLKPCIHKVNKG